MSAGVSFSERLWRVWLEMDKVERDKESLSRLGREALAEVRRLLEELGDL